MDVEDILQLVLVLVVIWLALEIVGEVIGILGWLLGPVKPLLGLAVILVIVLYLLDRL